MKAVLPIEDEINSESKSSRNEVKEMVEEGSLKPKEMIARMEHIQQQLFESAKINIDKAQDCYKRYNDMGLTKVGRSCFPRTASDCGTLCAFIYFVP